MLLGDGRLIGIRSETVIWRHDVLAGTWPEPDGRGGELTTGLVDDLETADVAAAED